MKPIPPLHRMRSLVSNEGHVAQFFLMFKGGQNAGFSIPYHKIGLLVASIRNVAKMMRERLSRAPDASAAETMAGLSDPAVVTAIAVGNNAETGDALLSIETADSGPFSFQLSLEAVKTLNDALQEHESRSKGLNAPHLRFG